MNRHVVFAWFTTFGTIITLIAMMYGIVAGVFDNLLERVSTSEYGQLYQIIKIGTVYVISISVTIIHTIKWGKRRLCSSKQQGAYICLQYSLTWLFGGMSLVITLVVTGLIVLSQIIDTLNSIWVLVYLVIAASVFVFYTWITVTMGAKLTGGINSFGEFIEASGFTFLLLMVAVFVMLSQPSAHFYYQLIVPENISTTLGTLALIKHGVIMFSFIHVLHFVMIYSKLSPSHN